MRRQAAAAPAQSCWPVIPSFSGGLHCGVRVARPRPSRPAASSRRSAAGSIAAACGTRSTSLASAGHPVVQRRAPLRRRASSVMATRRRRGHPVVQRRAPLRQRPANARRPSAIARSSRRSAAGSIAARCTRSTSHGEASASSRRSAAGSIAASRSGAWALAVVAGHPVVQRRAPLRLHRRQRLDDQRRASSRRSAAGSIAAPGDGDLCSTVMGGHPVVQRRAPLRRVNRTRLRRRAAWSSRRSAAGSIAARSSPSQDGRSPRRVIPSFSGGLHCGPAVTVAAFAGTATSSRRSAAGSIAARTPGPTSSACIAGSSRRSAAGSIAATQWAGRPPGDRSVIPSFSGGLHCGTSPGDGLQAVLAGHPVVQRRAPLRPPRRGDHAAGDEVIPSFSGGLHCGAPSERSSPVVGTWSSRRSAAGSIAATCRRRSARCGRQRSSRRSAAGSIAAPDRQDRCVAGQPVIPSFSGGLHCGSPVGRRCGGTAPCHPVVQRRAPLRPQDVLKSIVSEQVVIPSFSGGPQRVV